MHSYSVLFALVGITFAVPSPQLIDLAAIDAAADPAFVAAPLGVQSDIPPPMTRTAITSAATDVTKRHVDLVERDGSCAPQPSGSGPIPTPDTPKSFSNDQAFTVRLIIYKYTLCLT